MSGMATPIASRAGTIAGTIDVVIVNWNAGPYLRRTVEALARSEQRRFAFGRVVIVDNASTDGSLDGLEGPDGQGIPEAEAPARLPLEIIRNDTNSGFAAACNQGAADSEAEYLLFLNPDVEVEPQTLDRCVSAAVEMPDVGAIGVQLVDRQGVPQLSCSRFPTPARFTSRALGLDRLAPRRFPPHYLTEFDHRTSRRVDQVMGAFLFTPRRTFKMLGGFDERFFVYFEEVDYCYRLVKNGWSTYFLSSARAFHKGNSTTETVPSIRLFYNLRSRLAFGYKHFARRGALLQTLSTLTIEFVSRMLVSLFGGSPTAVLRGYRLLWRELPAIPRAPRSTQVAPNHGTPHEMSTTDEIRP